MKRTCALLLMAALLVWLPVMAMAEAAVDVQGFWYSDESEDGIELKNGKVILSNGDGETTAEGTYEAASNPFSFSVGGVTYHCTVSGNGMLVDAGDGIKHYARDGIEENYWASTIDDSAIELYGGQAWQYDDAGELIGEGTYEVDGNTVTITIEGKVSTGIIDSGTMTVDGYAYSIL